MITYITDRGIYRCLCERIDDKSRIDKNGANCIEIEPPDALKL